MKVMFNVEIRNVALVPENQNKSGPTGFTLECKDQQVQLVATSKQERDEWVEVFNKAREEYRKNDSKKRGPFFFWHHTTTFFHFF